MSHNIGTGVMAWVNEPWVLLAQAVLLLNRYVLFRIDSWSYQSGQNHSATLWDYGRSPLFTA